MRRYHSRSGGNRAGLVLVGLVLIAGGVGIALPALWAGTPWALDDAATVVAGLADAPWWVTAAAALVAILLVVVAVSWLRTQAPGERVARLGLSGSTAQERLSLDPAAAIRAANAVLGDHPDVRRSRLELLHRQGRVEVHGSVVARADGPLDRTTEDVLATLDDLATALEVAELPARVRIAVQR